MKRNHPSPLERREREPDIERLSRLLDCEGPAGLETHELLALLLLGRGAGRPQLELCAQLLANWGGLSGLATLRPRVFSAPGLNAEQATRVSAALEIARRLQAEPTRLLLGAPLDAALVAAWARPRLAHLSHEEVWVLCVDGRSVLRSTFQVGRGGIHGCSLLPRDVLAPVVRDSASGFIIVHNHPSGDPSPSFEDLELTQSLRRAAALVGSPLLDHVIVAGNRHTSLCELSSWGPT